MLMGNHILTGKALEGTYMQYMKFGEITLFGGHGLQVIDFKRDQWPGIIDKHSGLFNPPEPWGAWSISCDIKLKFVNPLPAKFDLEIVARAFGPNANRDINVHIGEFKTRFQLPKTFPEFERVILRIDNPNKLNELVIEIPEPVMPKTLGIGDDDRMIGLGLSSLSIRW